MIKRRASVVLALIVLWACFGLAVLKLADIEASRCHQFGGLAAECFAPSGLFLVGLSIVFALSSLWLAFLAIRLK